MEIKKIIGFCKKSKVLKLFEAEREQWICDGVAAFPLVNMPRFDEESILIAYDISDKQASKMIVRHDYEPPKSIDTSNETEDEIPCEIVDEIFGNALAIKTSRGMMFINSKYLRPFLGVDPTLLFVFERHTPDGGIYFAVKTGYMLAALVMPYDCVNEKFVDRLGDIYAQCKRYLQDKKERDKE